MLEEIKTNPVIQTNTTISLTTAAADAVKNILDERKLEGYALRIYVSGGGCCGVNFGMALDNNIRDVDTTFEMNGVNVVVDEVSIDYLRGASIDFINDPVRGAGFAVDSPMANAGSGSCACGSHEGSNEADSCGCGGSCSCNN
jgi:iron-sulfur cluster assembly protein